MDSKNQIIPELSRTFKSYTTDSKIYEIVMKKEIEKNSLLFQMVFLEGNSKKIYCSLYDFNSLKHKDVLSPYNTIEEVYDQIVDYLDVNEQLKINSSISFSGNKAILSIPINSRKYKELNFQLKCEDSELIEVLLDTIDKLIKKNEEFENRISSLEKVIFPEKNKEQKKDNIQFNKKFEILNNTKTVTPHNSYISNIILLKNNKIATSSIDYYINIYNKDTFEKEYSIQEHSFVDWIEQIKDGTLISCPRDNTIRLYEINDKSYKAINVIKESSSAWKMKELENGKLISTMSNGDIKIWNKNNNTIECEFTLKNGAQSFDILEIKKMK